MAHLLVIGASREQVTQLIDLQAADTDQTISFHVVASFANVLDRYTGKPYVRQQHAAKDVKMKRPFSSTDALILDQLVGKEVYGIDWIKASLEHSSALIVGSTCGTCYTHWTADWVKQFFSDVIIGPGTQVEVSKLAQLLGWAESDLRKHMSKDKYLEFCQSGPSPSVWALTKETPLIQSSASGLQQDQSMSTSAGSAGSSGFETKQTAMVESKTKQSIPPVQNASFGHAAALNPVIPKPPVPANVSFKTETLTQPHATAASPFYETLWFNAVLCPGTTEEQWDKVWEQMMVESELISKMWANADVQYTTPRRFVSCVYTSVAHTHLFVSLMLNCVKEWIQKGLIEEGGFFVRK